MKNYFTIISTILLIILSMSINAATLHDFKAKTIEGDSLDFSTLKGKRLLVVNTASKCGYTYQYSELQQLYDIYGGDKFLIVGFPANNFGNQEPGSDEDIENFCTENYGVTFQMMSKISVKGNDIHEIYQWLTQKSLNGVKDAPIQWNFQKFMIDENGNWIDVVMTQESPLCDKIINWLEDFTSVLDDKSFSNTQSEIYPNPFSQSTTIHYQLHSSDHVTLKVYNAVGVEVAVLVNEYQDTGSHLALFDASNLTPGIYYYTLQIGDLVQSNNLLLIK